MKKIIVALFFLVSSLGFTNVNAQQKATTKKTTSKTTVTKTKDSSMTKKPGMKKDGTPDMRYKENKTTKTTTTAPAGPTKKDGSLDMRYKANKTKTKSK